MFDVIDGCGEQSLVDRRDAAFHLGWVEASILPRHCNHWDIDVWEDVGWSLQNHYWTDDQNQQPENDERIWPAQGNLYDPHRTSKPFEEATLSPSLEKASAVPINRCEKA
jgi:hypothetical protein